MLYFDTSFLAPIFQPEDTSREIEAFINDLPKDLLATSQWTSLEFSSLIARKVRMGLLPHADAKWVDTQFELALRDSFDLLSPAAADFELAKRYVLQFETALRAGDALHLAIAKNNRATSIYTLDKSMAKAGDVLGLPVSLGIRAH